MSVPLPPPISENDSCNAHLTPPTSKSLYAMLRDRLTRCRSVQDKFEVLAWFEHELRKANQRSAACGNRFSRACSACKSESSEPRVLLTECDHVICRECADEARDAAGNACPVCDTTPTAFVRLYENEQSSRQCLICLTAEPFWRSAFPTCGHIICSACATKLIVDACSCSIPCPFCRVQSAPSRFVEKVIDGDSSEEENEED